MEKGKPLSNFDRAGLAAIVAGQARHKAFPLDTRRDGVTGMATYPLIDVETGAEVGELSETAANLDLSSVFKQKNVATRQLRLCQLIEEA